MSESEGGPLYYRVLGNGTGGGNLSVNQVAPGWWKVEVAPPIPGIERFPSLLTNGITFWSDDHPAYRVVLALGLLTEGYTTEIHFWAAARTREPLAPEKQPWKHDGIIIEGRRSGWIVVRPESTDTPCPKPEALTKALDAWLKERPEFALVTVLPIAEAGHTTALHVWYGRAPSTSTHRN